MGKGIEDIIDEEEFVCLLCPRKGQSVTMPLELPTSESLPVAAQHNMVSAKPSTTTSAVNTIVLNKDKVITSVCDTLLSSQTSSSQSDHPKTIDLVVISSTPNTMQAGQFTTTTSSSCQYKLSEIVSREKDLLFQKSVSSEVELEPARQSVYSVRRRNRQFFTVTEEEENESDTDSHTSSADKEKKDDINHIFNLGESLKRLYYPEQHKQRGKRERKVRTFKRRHHNGDLHGYESDPEGKIGLCDIVKNNPDLRPYNSHPELNWTDNIAVDETVGILTSKSLPNTPRVSPKLIRRNSLKNQNQNEVQKSGPGFSFLASVAGELHIKRKQHEKGIMKISDGQGSSVAVKTKSSEPPQKIVQPQTVTRVEHPEPSRNIHAQHFHDFTDSEGVDQESHGPISISSIITWGTTKKINVSNKETNMFSPSSF